MKHTHTHTSHENDFREEMKEKEEKGNFDYCSISKDSAHLSYKRECDRFNFYKWSVLKKNDDEENVEHKIYVKGEIR